MKTLELSPDNTSYSVKAMDDIISVATLGGPPRRRKDLSNATVNFTCVFNLTPKQFDYFMDFYRNFIKRPLPFNILLISDFSDPLSPLVNHNAYLVPGTVKLASVIGHRYSVNAQLEAFIPD